MNNSKAQFTPPREVQEEARQGLECLEKGSKAGTQVGRYRARQLANGNKISFNVIKRMRAFFDRHEKNKSYSGEPCKDKGYVAWKLWGGDSGREWANQIYSSN